MARPKSKEPTKDRKISLRVTEANYMKIKSVYGSIQRFFDLMLKILPVLILVSCNGQEVSSLTNTNTPTVNSPIMNTGVTYARATWLQRTVSLGYKINYSCDANECEVAGELRTYLNNTYYSGTGYITEFFLLSSTLRKSEGDFYQGQICDSYSICLDMRLNVSTGYVAISNGTDCMDRSQSSNQSDYEAFMSSFSQVNQDAGYLTFWTGTPKSFCGF